MQKEWKVKEKSENFIDFLKIYWVSLQNDKKWTVIRNKLTIGMNGANGANDDGNGVDGVDDTYNNV